MDYWTIVDDRHAGPFSASQLKEMGLKPDSPVWASGMSDWVEAREIEELRVLLETAETDCDPTPPLPSAEVCIEVQPAPPLPQQPASPAVEPAMPQHSMQPTGVPVAAAPMWEWQRPVEKPAEPCPPAYLAWSIIVTLLCCQVLGIAAIICSAMVKQNYNRGNLLKAEKCSNAAQWLIMLAIVLGLVSMPLQLLLF